ncbi:hypothetical protein ACLQ2S_26290 [Micromonospora sp. DT48]|uniref:hypothetical protein n=1 Tax=Micromonospora sp. DT48 TaxID=3393429 RepID=UPI003CF0FE64
MKIVGCRLVYALPKARKNTGIPLPSSVGAALTRHLENFPPVPVSLPWEVPGGSVVTVNLVVHGRTNVAMDRHTFIRDYWRPVDCRHPAFPGHRDARLAALLRLVLIDFAEKR